MYKVRNDYLIKQLTSGADQSDISAISAIMEFMEYTQMESEDLWEYIIHNVKDPEFFMNSDTKVKYMQEMATDTTIGLRSLRLPDLVLENIINAAYDTRSGLSTYEIMDKIDGIMRPNPVQTRAARFPGYKDPIERLGKTGVIGAGETLGVDYEL